MQQYTLKNGQLLTIRKTVPGDAEGLLAFVEKIATESENITFGPGEFGMTVEQEREFLRAANASNNLYLVATIEDMIAGTLIFNTGKRPRIRHSGEFSISVLRKYWNLGIGNRLLTYLIDRARASGEIRKINLRVRVDNMAAIHLYEKHGFVREGRITREFYINGQFIDVYFMGLAIDPPQK